MSPKKKSPPEDQVHTPSHEAASGLVGGLAHQDLKSPGELAEEKPPREDRNDNEEDER